MIRPIGYTADDRRIFATLDTALEAQQRMAQLVGIYSGVTSTDQGYVMLYDPWPTLDVH
jgi:hypothetical protein